MPEADDDIKNRKPVVIHVSPEQFLHFMEQMNEWGDNPTHVKYAPDGLRDPQSFFEEPFEIDD